MTIKVQCPENIIQPQVVENEDQLVKMLIAETMFLSENNDTVEAIIRRLKIIMHDYLALVATGKMKPFECQASDYEKDAVKELLSAVTQMTARVGVPMRETDKGDLEIDLEKFKKGETE